MDVPQLILPAIAVAIFNHEGQILLQKRRDVDKWGILSGHVEFGESVEDAALREIFEETGVRGKILRFIGIYSFPLTQTYHYKDKTAQYVTSYFEGALTGDLIPGYTNEETLELGFFSPDELPENLAQANPHWLNDAMDKSGKVFIR